MPLSFEPNRGQADSAARFISRSPGYSLWLESAGARFQFGGHDKSAATIVRMDLANANREAVIAGEDQLLGKSDYLPTGDPKTWITDVPTYARVRYEDIYPGVDVAFYGAANRLEYDFMIQPGADPGSIQMNLSGSDAASIDGNGDLVVRLAEGDLRFLKPVVYQLSRDGKTREAVSGAYVLNGATKGKPGVTFALGKYDHSRQLIIDPVVALNYSELLPDYVGGVAVDSSGNTYVSGSNYSNGFYVTKFNTSGTVVYNATLGTGYYDWTNSIAIGSTGEAYVSGQATNGDGTVPTSTNAYLSTPTSSVNGFLTVLSAGGSSVVYGTYLGGTDSNNTVGTDVAVDSSGDAYLTGVTDSATYPVTSGVYQTAFPGSSTGFVTKINPAASTGAASLVYSTLLGPNNTILNSIAVDSSGDAYVAADAPSGYPVTSGAFEYTGIDSGQGGVYVTKLNPTATALVYSAYLGYGNGNSIAVEGQSSPSAYVTGFVSGADFPVTAGAYQTDYAGGYLVKLNSTGTAETYSTFLGGPISYTGGTSVYPGTISLPYGCSSSCNAYVAGWTSTTDFPQIDPIQTTPEVSGYSGFVTEIAANGASALFSSYVSGVTSGVQQPNNRNQYGQTPAIAVDSSGNMSFVANFAYSPQDFPITISTANPANAFLARISPSSSPATFAYPTTIAFGNQPVGVSTSINSGTATARVYNMSSTAATLQPIQVSPSSIFSESDNCNESIPAGGYCTLDLNFGPNQSGSKTGTVTITSNASNSPTTVTVTGTGYDTAYVQASVSSLTFATQTVGTVSASQSVTFTNIGDETTPLTLTVGTSAFSTLNNCPSQLVPGASCTASVTFTPTQVGLSTDTLTGAVSGGPYAYITLSGTGAVSGGTSSLVFTATSLQFNPQVVSTTSGVETFYLTNTGSEPAVIQSVAASGDFFLSYQSNSAPFQLNPQQTVQYNVQFSPTAVGARTGAVTFTDDATGSPQAVALSGTGLASTDNVEFYPSSAVSFPDTPVGVTSGTQLIYLENTGTAPLTVDRVIPSGEFQISSTNCEGIQIPGTSPDGLGSASTCYVYVTFTPTATGAQTGTLTFTDSASGSPHVVNLTGNGIAATGSIQLNPDGLNFSTQPVGTTGTAQYTYVVNPGDSPVTVSSYTFTGTNASDFSVSSENCTPPYALATNSGESCYLYVQFTPGATGSRTGTLNVNSSAGTQTAALTGTGVAATQTIGLTPTSMNQGSIVVGQTSTYDYVYLRNTGTETVTFSANPTVTGTNASEFVTTNYCATTGSTLAPGGTCYILVQFTPGAAGARSATLTFTDSAGTQTLALSGTGVSAKPTYTVSDYLISYNTQVEGTTSSLSNYVYFYNNGSTSVTLGNVAITGNFVVPSGYNSCNGQTIAAASSCYVYVQFAPTSTGYLTGTLTFNNSGGTALSGAPVIPLAGFSATPTYSAYIDPTALDYTSIQVIGTTSAYSPVTLYNTGNTALTVGTITGTDFGVASSSAEFSVAAANGGSDGCSGTTVQPGSTCTVYPTFTPNAAGARTGTMSFPITYANSSTATITANLSGTGVAEKDSAVLTPPNGTFIDQVVNTTTPYSVTAYLNNSGNQPFTVGTLTNTDSSEFSTASSVGGYDGCSGVTVQAASSCQVNIRFTPSTTGPRTGSIGFPVTFADHATTIPTLALTGTGVASANTIAITPANIQFGTEIQSVASTYQGLTVTNTGNSTVTIGTDSISTNSAEFGLYQDNCSGRALTASQNCTIYVNFTPSSSATGTQTGALKIADNATGGPHTVALSGIAIAATSQIALSQTTLAFGNQPAGSTSSAQVVNITNQGDSAVTVSSIALSGTNAADFTTSTNCSSLSGHSTCSVSVQFVPPAGASGNLTATITETDSATPGTHTISLTGTAVAPGSAAALSPTSLTFPTQNVGTTSAAQTLSVTNTGSANLTVSMVTSTNSTEFPISLDGCSGTTLPTNQHCVVSVKFSPSLGGARSGSIQVTDNATGSPQTVAVTGTGYGIPSVILTPSSLTFSSTNIGSTSATQTITLKDTGTDTVQISSIGLTGVNAGDFAQTNTCGATLAPAASCVITVSFKPTASGTRGASITVTDNANNVSGSMQNASLTGTGVAVPTAGLAPTALTFSSTNIGVNSAAQTATLTNSGTGPLTIASVAISGAAAGDYSETNTCGATLNAGTNCTISVTFKPTASGTRTATVTVTDNANNVSGTTQTVSLTGTGTGLPTAGLSPTVVAFSNTNVGATASAQTFTLTNSGTGPLTIASVTITGTNPGDFAETNTCGSSLAAGANCTISITFTPTAPGGRSATLTVTDNANNTPGSTQTAALSGTGVGNPIAGASPSGLTFANTNVGTTTPSQTVTLTNAGTGPLTISSIVIGGTNPGDFAETNNCPGSLAVNANCAIAVTFDPTAVGSRSANLHIIDNSNNVGATQTVALSGTGTVPTAGLSPNSLTFAPQTVGTTSAAQSVTLSNSGTGPLTIASIGFTGANPGDFAQTNNCGTTVAAAGSCTISVTFTPAAVGSPTATLTVTDNSGNVSGSTQSVTLAGTGANTTVSLSATSLTFAAQEIGTTSTTQSVTLTNTGGATLSISSITLTGADASSFAFANSCGSNLATGANCTIHGHFSPASAGALTATITITDNGYGSPQTISLSGTGNTPPTVSLSANSLSFGNQETGTTSSSQTVTLTNTGDYTLTISSIAVTGADASSFAFANSCGSSVAAGANCTIHGHFGPTTSGALTAAITITDNASDSPQSISLTGTGTTPPAVSLSATSLSFGTQAVGTTSASQSVTLTNTGGTTLSITSISMTGSDASSFMFANSCGSSLAAGANCTIHGHFTPATTGALTAAITITDNASGSPQSITLSGTGQ